MTHAFVPPCHFSLGGDTGHAPLTAVLLSNLQLPGAAVSANCVRALPR